MKKGWWVPLPKFAVPPGIGDALWSLTKVQSIIKQYPKDSKCIIVSQNTSLNRSQDFMMHFDFVDDAVYEPFLIHPRTILNPISVKLVSDAANELGINLSLLEDDLETAIAQTGEYIYLKSQPNFMDKYDWLLIANGHLERGYRLETWLPQFDTNFNIGVDNFVFTESELMSALNIHSNVIGSNPYVVFYLGPKVGNTKNGHNRNSLWTFEDWHNTALLMREHNSELKVVLVGATYDLEYTSDFLSCHQSDFYVNLVGKTTIGLTYAVIKRSRFILSYQSGIGIFSCYLGVPSACFWRPKGDSISSDFYLSFEEAMASAWAPEWSLGENGNYLPLIYKQCSPISIVDEVVNRQWI